MAGAATGAYGLYAGASGLAAAMMAYNYGKKRQRKAVIERALKERRKQRFDNTPATVYARPLREPAPMSEATKDQINTDVSSLEI
jgi:hypothetical protein